MKPKQVSRLEQMEVKTISERSHEDSSSQAANTPGHHHYLSGLNEPAELSSARNNQLPEGVIDYGLLIGGGDNNINAVNSGPKKQIQILELLNEICDDQSNATLI